MGHNRRMPTALRALPLLVLLAGCTGAISQELEPSDAAADGRGDAAAPTEAVDASTPGTDASRPPDRDAGATTAPLVVRKYSGAPDDVLNPERGFMDAVDLVSGSGFSQVRASGRTVAYAGVHLDAYRTTSLDPAFLSSLSAGFARARAAGLKVVLRFSYNDGPYPNPDPDASKAIVQQHVSQLEALLRANADVIAVLQAGFIGAWGEWHSSTNGLDTPANKKEILLAILKATPPSLAVQVRAPADRKAIFGQLAEADAFSGSDGSRTGHHNDCFLASSDDFGTYPSPVEDWKTFVATDTRFVPMGGETCAVNAPRTNCAAALAELARLHYSYLNALYHPQVIAGWSAQGCLPEIKKRLGYRLVLDEVTHTERLAPGGVLELQVKLHNEGFAAPFNARPVFAVLERAGLKLSVRLARIDPRRFAAGDAQLFSTRLRLPGSAAEGIWRLSLLLPDPSATIEKRPEFAVRFANAGTFDAASGLNVLGDVAVDANAPGEVDGAATTFSELP